MLLEINFTIVLFAISFLVFIYLLNLTLYKPVGNIIEARKSLIESEYKKSKELTEQATSILENYKNQIKSAKQNAQNIIQEVINLATKKKEEKTSSLILTLNKEKEIAIKQIKAEQEIAIKKLENDIQTLKDLITNKVLGMGEKDLARTY